MFQKVHFWCQNSIAFWKKAMTFWAEFGLPVWFKKTFSSLKNFYWKNYLQRFAMLFPSLRVFDWQSWVFLGFDPGRFPIVAFSFGVREPPPRLFQPGHWHLWLVVHRHQTWNWFDLITRKYWFDFNWFDFTLFSLIWFDFTLFDLNWFDFDLIRFDLIWFLIRFD